MKNLNYFRRLLKESQRSTLDATIIFSEDMKSCREPSIDLTYTIHDIKSTNGGSVKLERPLSRLLAYLRVLNYESWTCYRSTSEGLVKLGPKNYFKKSKHDK